MARKNSKNMIGESLGNERTGQEPVSDVRLQMEVLRRELHQLAQRAEVELEDNLRKLPSAILEMVSRTAHQTSASAAGVWLDFDLTQSFYLDGISAVALTESDKLQCGLAWTGREMCFDFASSKVFLPIVVFENPIALAVLEVRSMSTLSYESICAVALRELKLLRANLKNIDSRSLNSIDAAS